MEANYQRVKNLFFFCPLTTKKTGDSTWKDEEDESGQNFIKVIFFVVFDFVFSITLLGGFISKWEIIIFSAPLSITLNPSEDVNPSFSNYINFIKIFSRALGSKSDSKLLSIINSCILYYLFDTLEFSLVALFHHQPSIPQLIVLVFYSTVNTFFIFHSILHWRQPVFQTQTDSMNFNDLASTIE